MGIFDGLFGHLSEVDTGRLEQEFAQILVKGEEIRAAYKLIRDMYVFTNRRLILVERLSLTSRKTAYLSIPYADVSRFSIETGGTFDADAELRIWLRGAVEPLKQEFRRGDDIHRVHRTLAEHVLK